MVYVLGEHRQQINRPSGAMAAGRGGLTVLTNIMIHKLFVEFDVSYSVLDTSYPISPFLAPGQVSGLGFS